MIKTLGFLFSILEIPAVMYWTKKKGIILVVWPISVHVERGYMGYEILLTYFTLGYVINSVISQAWKGCVRSRIFTRKIITCVDRRHFYLSLWQEKHKMLTKSACTYAKEWPKDSRVPFELEWKRKKTGMKIISPFVNG